MPTEVREEELLRSIEEVEDRIRSFQMQVQNVLASAQSETAPEGGSKSSG